MTIRTYLVGVTLLMGTSGVLAEPANLTLTGGGEPAVWDVGTTANWLNGSSELTTFANGDDVTIGDAFTGSSLMMQGRLAPRHVVFDLAEGRTLTWGWGAAQNSVIGGLSSETVSLTKKGKGTLLVAADMGGASKPVAANSGERGNAFTCLAEILEGDVRLKNLNVWQSFGSHDVTHTVRIADGASLTFTERNQAGTPMDGSALDVELADGAALVFHTNYTGSVNNLINSLHGLTFTEKSVFRYGGYANNQTALVGGPAFAFVGGGLHFAGDTPHVFSKARYTPNAGAGDAFIALSARNPVTFTVNDITSDASVDADVNMNAFVWGTNAVGATAIALVKDGPGTVKFSSLASGNGKPFYGDIAVVEGTAVFAKQALLPVVAETGHERLSTLAVSNGAVLRFESRNVMNGDLSHKPPLRIVIDHATFAFVTTDANAGLARAREWVFDDAELVVTNKGLNASAGVWGFLDRAEFRGRKPYDFAVNPSVNANCQVLHVGCDPATDLVVDDITGDSAADVTFSMPVYDTATNNNLTVASGFVKKGEGTLAIASKTNRVSGDIRVDAGTLRVDGVLTTPASVAIASGGFLGGTGTVANVTLAEGAGFAIRPSDKGHPLDIQGDLALPAQGVIVMNADAKVKKMKFATVSGTITGTDLSGWQVRRPDGTVVRSGDGLWVRGNSLYGGERQGVALVIR